MVQNDHELDHIGHKSARNSRKNGHRWANMGTVAPLQSTPRDRTKVENRHQIWSKIVMIGHD